jgi:uncharacterized protein (TIGR00369 family)
MTLFFIRSLTPINRNLLATTIEPVQPRHDRYQDVVRESFARQRFMETIGAKLIRVAPGEVDIELPFRDDLVQQSGTLHAGVVTAIADSACGYAVLTLMPEGQEVLSVEFKVNLLAPAAGGVLVARAKVLRAGRTLTVCAADVVSGDRLVATMLATMIGR